MAVELEGLEFQIEAKSEEGTKGIDALTASLGKLKQATKGGLGLNSKVKELNKLNEALKGFHTDKLESLGKALASLNGLGKTQISSTIPKRLNEIAQSLHEIGLSDIERLEDLGKALRDLQEVGDVKIPKVTVPSAGVAPTMNGTTNAKAATSGVEQATSSVQETAHAVEQVTQKTGVLKSILGGIGGVFSKRFSVGTGALHKLANALTKVKVAGAKARAVLGKIKDALGSALAAKVKQNTSGLGKLFNSMKRIAMYRAIRFMFAQLTQAMKDGINNLYQYSNLMGGTFAQSMDRLATSGQYLKNSLGAMAAPIINALAPAIDFVIDKIATLLNYINMLFARLSGASVFTAAKKNAVSYGDSLTKAGGSAAKAAKEIRDATTGIDELNIIMQKNDDAGGGGGGGSNNKPPSTSTPNNNKPSSGSSGGSASSPKAPTTGSTVRVKPGRRWYYDSEGMNPSGPTDKYANQDLYVVNTSKNKYQYAVGKTTNINSALGWLRKEDLVGFDTGGYTGSWGKEGRIAMLHEKEIVLNQTDTSNILDAVKLIRNGEKTNSIANITKAIMETSAKTISALTNIVNSMMPNSNAPSPISHSENFEQVVNINADFSGVRTADEIEKAFANMENMASQYANRTR